MTGYSHCHGWQIYGGPCLQTQQTILETQHNIFETQVNICETQNKIIDTQPKIIETQHKIVETQHKIIKTQHKIIETTHFSGCVSFKKKNKTGKIYCSTFRGYHDSIIKRLV